MMAMVTKIKQTIKTPFICGLDTEDDGAGTPFLWCFVHSEGQWNTSVKGEAVKYIETLASTCALKDQQLEIWCTNLEYDLCNLFDVESIKDVHLRFGRSALCGARYKGAEFRCTLRHLPISVAKLGELVGLPKLETSLFEGKEDRNSEKRSRIPFKNRGDNDWRRYLRRCIRDATITYRAAKLFKETYQGLGDRGRMTLASTALNLWKSVYFQGEVSRPDIAVWKAAYQAYHGGRTEAFYIGSFLDVVILDVASMYPWAMTCKELPKPWGLYREVGGSADINPFGVYRIRVRARSGQIPLLPYRSKDGTIYPRGEWTGWYVGEEIAAFAATGGSFRLLEGFEFGETCRPFDEYIADIYALKQKSRGPERDIYKLLLNGLYGKFGQQGFKIRCVPIEKMLELEKPPIEWRPWLGMAIWSEEHAPPPWSNMIWCAFITARARIRLWEMMRELDSSGARILYCDTDSIFYQPGKDSRAFPVKAVKIGDFERRGHFREVIIVGKKEYLVEKSPGIWEPYAKGVPHTVREKYLRTGVAEFSRPTRIREASRLNSPVNTWRKVIKKRRKNLKSIARPNGALPTPQIAD
jgi:hypothetical protein